MLVQESSCKLVTNIHIVPFYSVKLKTIEWWPSFVSVWV